jgi:Ran GTPase-activating protein (RanGAP) involved in mRNA processing and transport
VLGKVNPAPGLYIIHLKEIKPPFPLLQPPFTHSITSTKSARADANDKSNNKTSFEVDAVYTVPMKPSQSVTTKLQQPLSHSTKPSHNQKLETLIQQKATIVFAEFRERHLNDEDAHLIANELARNTVWETLSLVENNIETAGIVSLSNALESNSTLQSLRLDHNQLEDDSITYLFSALKVNKTLEELVLSNNKISDAGAKQLADMLEVNRSLREIVLLGNEIGDSGIAAFATALKVNTTLRQLDLKWNKITDQSVHAIKGALLQNKTLNSLKLSNNLFFAEVKATLLQAAKKGSACVYV